MDAIRDFRSVLNATGVDDLKARAGNTRTGMRTLVAYVNHGRWIADCLCGSGVACSPDFEQAVCLECGTVHRVTFPTTKAIAAAAKVLAARPMSARNWRPEIETRNDLAAENVVRGLPTKGEL